MSLFLKSRDILPAGYILVLDFSTTPDIKRLEIAWNRVGNKLEQMSELMFHANGHRILIREGGGGGGLGAIAEYLPTNSTVE